MTDITKREQIAKDFNSYYPLSKLNAVKLFKDLTGLNLKEAKDWIDEHWNENLGASTLEYIEPILKEQELKIEIEKCKSISYFYENYVTIKEGNKTRKPNQEEIDLIKLIEKAQQEGKQITYYNKTRRFKI